MAYIGIGHVHKQNGGKGQMAHCTIEVEPAERGEGLTFINAITGGAIPKQFIASIETGVRQSAEAGVLRGYQVTDLIVTLTDGKYHEVDSSEYAFKEAGRLAFEDACNNSPMTLLEPISEIEVLTPEEYVGSILGDLSKRRCLITDQKLVGVNMYNIIGKIPVAETFGYSTDLRSISQGRASFSLGKLEYKPVPNHIMETL